MVIDVQCFEWSATGMVVCSHTENAYVSVREVERLCEEAHARGRRQAQEAEDEARRERLADRWS